jgi:hypothetical protein
MLEDYVSQIDITNGLNYLFTTQNIKQPILTFNQSFINFVVDAIGSLAQLVIFLFA